MCEASVLCRTSNVARLKNTSCKTPPNNDAGRTRPPRLEAGGEGAINHVATRGLEATRHGETHFISSAVVSISQSMRNNAGGTRGGPRSRYSRFMLRRDGVFKFLHREKYQKMRSGSAKVCSRGLTVRMTFSFGQSIQQARANSGVTSRV